MKIKGKIRFSVWKWALKVVCGGPLNKSRQSGCRLWSLAGGAQAIGGATQHPKVGDGLAEGKVGVLNLSPRSPTHPPTHRPGHPSGHQQLLSFPNLFPWPLRTKSFLLLQSNLLESSEPSRPNKIKPSLWDFRHPGWQAEAGSRRSAIGAPANLQPQPPRPRVWPWQVVQCSAGQQR